MSDGEHHQDGSSQPGQDSYSKQGAPENPAKFSGLKLLFSVPSLVGLLAMILVGLIGYGISQWLAGAVGIPLDALVIALLLGLMLKNVLPEQRFSKWLAIGADLGSKIFVPLGIILYGANLDFSRLASLPGQVIVITLLSMGLFYILIYWLNRWMWKLPQRLNELLATGSAICGASAIVVLAPAIDAKAEETSTSLLSITAVGLLALMVYPILQSGLNLTDAMYGLLSGASLHQMGLVRTAIAHLDPGAAEYAIAAKSLRILMLAPVAIVSGLLHLLETLRTPGEQQPVDITGEQTQQRQTIRESRLGWLRPVGRVWFLLPFLIMALLTSFSPAVRDFMLDIKAVESITLATALASIGFSINIESVLRTGSKPVLVALIGWIGVVLFFLFAAPFFIV